MIKKFSLSFGLSLLFLVSALCVSSGSVPLAASGPLSTIVGRGQALPSPVLVGSPKVSPAEVRLFVSGVRCPEAFEPVVVFWGHGMDLSGEGRVLWNLKVKAAKLGANGLVLSFEAMLNIGALPIEGVIPGDQKWAVMAIRFKSLD